MVTRKNSNSLAGGERAGDRNEDPLTGEPGSHPVGTGLGAAAGGAAAGAVAGAVGGPVGAAVGAVIGGVAGGLGGKAIAEGIDPTAETEYWRSNYSNRPYAQPDVSYDQFEPAYRTGWESYDPNSRFEDRESDLQRTWEATKGKTQLSWEKAKFAARDAWDRVASSGSANAIRLPIDNKQIRPGTC